VNQSNIDMGHEWIVETNSPGQPLLLKVKVNGSLRGYLAVDSLVGGRCCGGVRLMPDLDETEMRGLARAMTLKYGFLGLPQGGAKAGVLGNPEASTEERHLALNSFAQAIAPLLSSRFYVPGTDMGTNLRDIRQMVLSAGITPGRRELQESNSGYFTALSVYSSVKVGARQLGLTLSQCSAVVEGLGKVGMPLVELLASSGIKVVAVSTSRRAIYNPQGLDVQKLYQLSEQYFEDPLSHYSEAEQIPLKQLLELPVEIVSPCARHNSIGEAEVPRLRARLIAAGANNPVTSEAELSLAQKGILYLPDFVSNCGGVLGGTMEYAGWSRHQISKTILEDLGNWIQSLLSAARRQNRLPGELAAEIALAQMVQLQQAAKRPSLRRTIFHGIIEAYRRGWIPRWLPPLGGSNFFKNRFGHLDVDGIPS
jgi:glutamate dehydrogenase (NAD(P)+)